jgi:hypothetical protein
MSVKIFSSDDFRSPMRLALIVGAAAALISGIGFVVAGAQAFFQAYLFAYLFIWSLTMGCLGLLLLYFLTGSRWGLAIRRVAEAGAAGAGLLALLFIPLALGLTVLYPWSRPEEVAASAALQAKGFYLNVPFFFIRAVVYFIVWIGLAYVVNSLSARLSRASGEAHEALRERLQGWGAGGLILFFFTVTFASIDWLMSLQPFWSSTIFGLMTIVGAALMAMSFAILVLNGFPSLSLGFRWGEQRTPLPYKDLGALMLTLVMGWAYLAYFQMLIIWAGNIPREVVWYIARVEGGWSLVAIFIAVFQFFLPFLLLIFSRARHNLRALAGVGGLLLFTNLVNLFWNVKPAFFPGQLSISWLDIVLPIALGGLWLAYFLFNLQRRPALREEEQAQLDLVSEGEPVAQH